MEDGGWRIEDGGWRIEDGGWRVEDNPIIFKSRRDDIIIDDGMMTNKNPEGMTLL
jgi:hypothetical protein